MNRLRVNSARHFSPLSDPDSPGIFLFRRCKRSGESGECPRDQSQAKPPCGGTSSPLPLPLCLPPDRRVHAGGPALVLCTLSRVMSSCRPSRSLLWLWVSLVLRGGIGAVPGTAPRSASLRSLWSSTRVARLLWHALPRLVWWPSHLAKRSHSCWACCSWTSSSCSSVRRLLVVS